MPTLSLSALLYVSISSFRHTYTRYAHTCLLSLSFSHPCLFLPFSMTPYLHSTFLSISYSFSFSLSLSLSLSLTHTHTFSLSPIVQSLSLFIAHFCLSICSLSLPHSLSPSHTLTFSFTPTTNRLSLSPYLPAIVS